LNKTLERFAAAKFAASSTVDTSSATMGNARRKSPLLIVGIAAGIVGSAIIPPH
jgi:hypothetical protein